MSLLNGGVKKRANVYIIAGGNNFPLTISLFFVICVNGTVKVSPSIKERGKKMLKANYETVYVCVDRPSVS